MNFVKFTFANFNYAEPILTELMLTEEKSTISKGIPIKVVEIIDMNRFENRIDKGHRT